MKHVSSPLRALAVLSFVIAQAASGAEPAAAAPGDLVADLYCEDSVASGVSVAFDGTFLYYTNWNGTALHRVSPPPPGGTVSCNAPPSDPNHVDFAIFGTAGINALSYDRLGSRFWGVGSDGLSIYTLTVPNGFSPYSTASLQFVISPAQLGNCDYYCGAKVNGLAFDGTGSTSLWFSPSYSQRVYRFATSAGAGGSAVLLSSFDVHTPPNDMAPDCGFNDSSGVAAGANVLYLQAYGCTKFFAYSKSGTKQAVFTGGGDATEDSECDNVTYTQRYAIGKEVIWLRDSYDGHFRAYEIPAGTCLYGGGVAPGSGGVLPPLPTLPPVNSGNSAPPLPRLGFP